MLKVDITTAKLSSSEWHVLEAATHATVFKKLYVCEMVLKKYIHAHTN
jgi:hypothetical protein